MFLDLLTARLRRLLNRQPRKRPTVPQTWSCVATRAAVEVTKKDFFARPSLRFPRAEFEVDGKLPSPAV